MSLFSKVVGHARGSEQWNLFNLSKLQSLLLESAASLKCDPFVCTKSQSGPTEAVKINQHVFTAYMEATWTHKYTS